MILDILYATQTGNAETVAKKLQLLAKNQGFNVNLVEMNYHNINSFSQLRNVAIVTSTYGNGEIPEMGMEFWEELKSSKIEMVNLRYGVIALGDKSHEIFCGAGRTISKKLGELKCIKVIPDLECDGDTEGTYEWSIKFLEELKLKAYYNDKV
tara:strand:- start:632 stop:1090 length:459 start_codon:yes stop_codon:yes gene_type:complete